MTQRLSKNLLKQRAAFVESKSAPRYTLHALPSCIAHAPCHLYSSCIYCEPQKSGFALPMISDGCVWTVRSCRMEASLWNSTVQGRITMCYIILCISLISVFFRKISVIPIIWPIKISLTRRFSGSYLMWDIRKNGCGWRISGNGPRRTRYSVWSCNVLKG